MGMRMTIEKSPKCKECGSKYGHKLHCQTGYNEHFKQYKRERAWKKEPGDKLDED